MNSNINQRRPAFLHQKNYTFMLSLNKIIITQKKFQVFSCSLAGTKGHSHIYRAVRIIQQLQFHSLDKENSSCLLLDNTVFRNKMASVLVITVR